MQVDPIMNAVLWTVYFLSMYFSFFWFLTFLDTTKDKRTVPKLQKFPFVTIIVPAYNEAEAIGKTLKSVVSLNYPKDKLEVIVVDDGSTDSTREIAQRFIHENPGSSIRLFSKKNGGKASAMNLGLSKAKGEFFVCLDADSMVQKETLRRQLAFYYAQDDARLAIVTPAMRVREPRTMAQKLQRLEYLFFLFVARLMSRLDCIFVAPGPFSLYRTDIVRKEGGFEEGNPTEDMEIAYRMQSRNYRIKQCPKAFVDTNTPSTFGDLYAQRKRWFTGGLVNLLKYRKMIMKTEYGDFGVLMMSVNIMSFLFCLSTIVFFVYFGVLPFIENVYHLYLVGFDFWPFLKDFHFNFNFLDMNLPLMFIIWFAALIAGTLFYVAHLHADERVLKHGVLPIPIYFMYYYLFLSAVVVVVLVQFARGRNVKW